MTKQDAMALQTDLIAQRCVDIDEFELYDDDEVRLDGVFSTQDLRTIVDALEALQAPGAWETAL